MEQLDQEKLQQFAKRLNCILCDDGPFAEMGMSLEGYTEKTEPIEGVTYDFYTGPVEKIQAVVEQVDDTWIQYFREDTPIFCAYLEGELVSFCIVGPNDLCPMALPGVRVGSIGLLENEMATHSSVLAWRILGTEEPGRRPSMGLHRVGHD